MTAVIEPVFTVLSDHHIPAMNMTFIHLSDVHFRPNWFEECDLVAEKFIVDLGQQIEKYENPYLIFSGDLVFSGSNRDQYLKFAEKFGGALDRLGIPRERRICVPGNHDVSQEDLKPLLVVQKGTLALIKEESVFNNELQNLSKTIFEPKFKNYKEAEASFANYSCCQESIGGTGWELDEHVGIYCLNTALCSFGGSKDADGSSISDKERLMIDTRSLNRWLASTSAKTKILVMHHPSTWLSDWASSELDKITASEFHLVLSGHVHEQSANFSTNGTGSCVHCVAPPLFTRKKNPLGYSFVSIDTVSHDVTVAYRHWTPQRSFVKGTALANTDEGVVTFSKHTSKFVETEVLPPAMKTKDVLSILQSEFDQACACYSSKRSLWVDRDFADRAETDPTRDQAVMTSPYDLAHNLRNCVVRAPKQFGLTCLGRFVALHHCREFGPDRIVVFLDASEMPSHRQGVKAELEVRCEQLGTTPKLLAGIVLDNCHPDKNTRRILATLQQEHPEVPVIMLQGIDDCAEIASAMSVEGVENFDTLYLWALSRSRIRELVTLYVEGLDLDEVLVTKRIIDDIDVLNIHRTPLNCLLLLKLAEQTFDESPVNRTEVIGRVLTLLFAQFDKIPKYSTRPDLKDCEYALGYFCEDLIRNRKSSFTKDEFHAKVYAFCKQQLLDLDIEVLFAFLVSENVLVQKGRDFLFRFSYWLHFFAAHRMLHDSDFAEFILGNGRYAAYPEILEFYAGIDRRRTDAITRLTTDLREMSSSFLERTGIAEDFNPYTQSRWSPNERAVELLRKEVTDGMAGSSLPAAVKDAAADTVYNRSRPYSQDLAQFIEHSSLRQLMMATKGVGRVLRNSDYVAPEAKAGLLNEVLRAWIRVCQILAMLSPVLAEKRSAEFEDMWFVLKQGFNQDTKQERWQALMNVICDNVVNWFHEDLFSRKMGPLFFNHIQAHPGELSEFLLMLVVIRQKPVGWEKEVEKFIVGEGKNSFYLARVFGALRNEFRLGFSNERTTQELRRLAAMAIAKHETGSKHPNLTLVRKAAAALDKVEKKRVEEDIGRLP